MRAALAALDEGEFTEGHELDRKWRVPKAMIGRRLTQSEAKRLLANSVDSRDYCPGPQDCLQTSCWLVQARLQEPVTPAGAVRLAATEAVPGTQAVWQFMATVSQFILQVVNAEPDGSNWGAGRVIGRTTPLRSCCPNSLRGT